MLWKIRQVTVAMREMCVTSPHIVYCLSSSKLFCLQGGVFLGRLPYQNLVFSV
jgi:hypothetical protein